MLYVYYMRHAACVVYDKANKYICCDHIFKSLTITMIYTYAHIYTHFLNIFQYFIKFKVTRKKMRKVVSFNLNT